MRTSQRRGARESRPGKCQMEAKAVKRPAIMPRFAGSAKELVPKSRGIRESERPLNQGGLAWLDMKSFQLLTKDESTG